ncbi:hypothetical protein [Echinicola shivajiensis]|uniref:hypothetical protein n=1 Tax=Echinicola shivajiensis TaxID=1035916 RepID=UPI001BFC63AB|nr:hypothetical protein [Echinicola shivajiensis]
MKHFYKFSIILYCLTLSRSVYSQINDAVPQELIASYLKLIPNPQEVYSGGQYAVSEAFHIEGTAFLESSEFTEGSLSINGLFFENILLNYDIQKDQLVTFHPNNYQRIILNARKVDSFTMGNGRYFIKINGNTDYYLHKNGYYEVLLEGEMAVLAKHSKVDELKKEVSSDDVRKFYFIHNTHFFIFSNGQFYRIKKKKDLASLLGIPKKQMNKVLKKEQLKFKKQTAESLVVVVQAHLSNVSKN